MEHKPTQAEKILQALQDAGEEGVSNYFLNSICFRYGARLFDLKQQGYDIQRKHVKGSEWRFILKTAPKQLTLV